jgi:hypothetical protein
MNAGRERSTMLWRRTGQTSPKTGNDHELW